MPLYDLPQEVGANFTDGAHQYFVYIAQQVPIFIPSVLLAFFIVVVAGGYLSERRVQGRSNFLQWLSISSFMTSTAAMLMLMVDGLITLTTVMITLAATVSFVTVFVMKGKE